MFKRIKSLNPGSYLNIKSTNYGAFESNNKYYCKSKAYSESRLNSNKESKPVEELNTILLESVRKRLMSDCEIGVSYLEVLIQVF